MNTSVYTEAFALAARAESSVHTGFCEGNADWRKLNADLGGSIPDWYIELVTSVPLSGLELGWQTSEPEKDDDGVSWMEWLDAPNVRAEMLGLYPGIALAGHGYLCVAGCSHGSGDQYFIATDRGDDPPLYTILHDAGNEASEIIANGRHIIAASLSDFFRAAQIRAKAVL